jgi:hypothetical protein
LKLANALAPGKKLRCPKCGEVFVPEADEEPDPPPKKAARPPTEADDEDAKPVKKKPAPVEDEAPEDDDAPARPKKKKKKPEKKSNVMLFVVGGGVAAVLLLAVATVGALWAFGVFGKAAPASAGVKPDTSRNPPDTRTDSPGDKKTDTPADKKDGKPGDGETWKDYTYAEAKIKLQFPAEPTKFQNPEVKLTSYECTVNAVRYHLTFTALTPDEMRMGAKGYLKLQADANKGRNNKDITLDGHPGFEITWDGIDDTKTKKIRVTERFYVIGNYFCLLRVVVAPPNKLDDRARVDQFFNSFQLVK